MSQKPLAARIVSLALPLVSRVLSTGRKPLAAGAIVGLLALSGCSTQYIPNTDVEETEQNRKVIEFAEEYRKAVERRNVALLLKMANPAYYEDGGNIDATDDIDYAGLREYLQTKFGDTKGIRYEIRYRNVSDGPGDVIWLDYTYSASYKVPSPQGDVWRRKVEDNRLELVPEGDSFTILRGM